VGTLLACAGFRPPLLTAHFSQIITAEKQTLEREQIS
jgi:hypothetical protein